MLADSRKTHVVGDSELNGQKGLWDLMGHPGETILWWALWDILERLDVS